MFSLHCFTCCFQTRAYITSKYFTGKTANISATSIRWKHKRCTSRMHTLQAIVDQVNPKLSRLGGGRCVHISWRTLYLQRAFVYANPCFEPRVLADTLNLTTLTGGRKIHPQNIVFLRNSFLQDWHVVSQPTEIFTYFLWDYSQ